jgi:phosphate-selective porin OprO/OprP
VFVRPLRRVRRSGLTDLGFGFAGSYGVANGTPTATGPPAYESTGQQVIFGDLAASKTATAPGGNDGPVMAAGERWRFTPQLYRYTGPFGLMAEYVHSAQHVQRGTAAGCNWRCAMGGSGARIFGRVASGASPA